MKKRYLIIILIFLLFLPHLSKSLRDTTQIIDGIEVNGKIEDYEAIESAILTLNTNIKALNNKDIKLYLSTLSPETREETKIILSEFFAIYDLNVDIKNIEIVSQNKDQIKLKLMQNTENLNEEHYRNHEATVGITFHNIENQWLIVESLMENTIFN